MAKGTFGERLKREREMREVSLQEITAATRIAARYLDALENEQWDRLPGGVFNRGFVRAIAHYLGLDEEAFLSEYDLARSEQKIEAAAPYESGLPSQPKWVPALAVLVVLAVLTAVFFVGRYAWRKYSAHHSVPNPVPAKPLPVSPQNSVSPPAAISPSGSSSPADPAAAPDSSSPLHLTVSTSAATRVRILADGNLVLDAKLPAGENRHFSAKERFEVTAADSSAVLLELNGEIMRPLGAPGSSGTIVLTQKDLRQTPSGTSQH